MADTAAELERLRSALRGAEAEAERNLNAVVEARRERDTLAERVRVLETEHLRAEERAQEYQMAAESYEAQYVKTLDERDAALARVRVLERERDEARKMLDEALMTGARQGGEIHADFTRERARAEAAERERKRAEDELEMHRQAYRTAVRDMQTINKGLREKTAAAEARAEALRGALEGLIGQWRARIGRARSDWFKGYHAATNDCADEVARALAAGKTTTTEDTDGNQ